ncbi:hypothetical protein [Paenibacillus lautus]|uniref:hypothetical protein n=1 Tax=Paenibacillus lautus TaxID=1401 RepID=UPI001C7CB92F|nr:hypothetical protein [Paenibacillus lautus]MBX4152377.1 hypothetical protein [Paenibacillus lautus]
MSKSIMIYAVGVDDLGYWNEAKCDFITDVLKGSLYDSEEAALEVYEELKEKYAGTYVRKLQLINKGTIADNYS